MDLVLTFSGVAEGSTTLTVPSDSSGAALTGYISIPANTPDGMLTMTVSLPAIGQAATASIQIYDRIAPALASYRLLADIGSFPLYCCSGTASNIVVGTPDTLAVTVTDNHALAYAGWYFVSTSSGSDSGLAVLGDTVQVSGLSSSLALQIAPPAALAGMSGNLVLFAIDADGNTSAAQQPEVIATLTTHPTTSVPRGATVSDVAFDTTRGLVYLAKPDSQLVAVLSLNPIGYQSPIRFTGAPVSLDLSPGGDSLIVGLASPPAVAAVNIALPTHQILGSRLVDSASGPDTLRSFRISGDNRVLAHVAHTVAGVTNILDDELNLTTGARQTIDSNTTDGRAQRVTRSGDRTHVLLLATPYYGSSTLYSTVTQSYENLGDFTQNIAGPNVLTSASDTGNQYQFGHIVIDTTLNQVFIGGVDDVYGASLAPNGVDYFMGTGLCTSAPCSDTLPGLLLHYTRPVRSPTEYVILPHPPYELAVSPNGKTLIGITADTIMAIDLTQSSPPLAALRSRVNAAARRYLRSRAHPKIAARKRAAPPLLNAIRVHFAGRDLESIPLRPLLTR